MRDGIPCATLCSPRKLPPTPISAAAPVDVGPSSRSLAGVLAPRRPRRAVRGISGGIIGLGAPRHRPAVEAWPTDDCGHVSARRRHCRRWAAAGERRTCPDGVPATLAASDGLAYPPRASRGVVAFRRGDDPPVSPCRLPPPHGRQSSGGGPWRLLSPGPRPRPHGSASGASARLPP